MIAIRDGREVDQLGRRHTREAAEGARPPGRQRLHRTASGTRWRSTRRATRWPPTAPARHMVIDMATIERRGDIGGFVSSIPPEDQFVQWRSERDADIIVSLASLAGERLFFDGDNSAGVGGDMRSATAVAARMLGYWSMGDTVASHGVSKLAIVGGSAGTAEDGTDRNFLETDLGQRVEEKLQAMLRGHDGAPPGEPHRGPGGRARARDAQDDLRRRHRGHHRGRARAARGRQARIRTRSSPTRWSGITRRPSRRTGSTPASTCRMPVPALVGAAMPSPNGSGNGRVRPPPELPQRPDIGPA